MNMFNERFNESIDWNYHTFDALYILTFPVRVKTAKKMDPTSDKIWFHMLPNFCRILFPSML